MKILLVQMGFLGDLVLSTPVIGAIGRVFPNCSLHVLTTPQGAELLSRDSTVAAVHVFEKRGRHRGIAGILTCAGELRKQKFDRVYSLHKSWRTALLLFAARIPVRAGFTESKLGMLYTKCEDRPGDTHEVGRALSILKSDFDAETAQEFASVCAGAVDAPLGALRLVPPVPEELSHTVRSLTNGERPYVVLVPGSVWHTKRWYPEGFRGVASEYLREGYRVVLLGSRSEREISDEVADGLAVDNLTGLTSLSELVYIISRAERVVCNDSMALHVASAFKIPTVAVFCATSPSFGFGPWQKDAAVVEVENLFCKPCRRHGSTRCPQGTEACMRGVASSRVLQAMRTIERNKGALGIIANEAVGR